MVVTIKKGGSSTTSGGKSKAKATASVAAKSKGKAKNSSSSAKASSRLGSSKAGVRRVSEITPAVEASPQYLSTSGDRKARAEARVREGTVAALTSSNKMGASLPAEAQARLVPDIVDARLARYNEWLKEQAVFYDHFLVRGLVGELPGMNAILWQWGSRIQAASLVPGAPHRIPYPLHRMSSAHIKTGLLCLAEAQSLHDKHVERIDQFVSGSSGSRFSGEGGVELRLSPEEVNLLTNISECFDRVLPMQHPTNLKAVTDIRHRTHVVALLKQAKQYLSLWESLGLDKELASSSSSGGEGRVEPTRGAPLVERQNSRIKIGAKPHIQHHQNPPVETYADKMQGLRSKLGFTQAHAFNLQGMGGGGGVVGIDKATVERLRSAKVCSSFYGGSTTAFIQEGIMVVRQGRERLAFLEALLIRANRSGYPPHLRLARNASRTTTTAAAVVGGGGSDGGVASSSTDHTLPAFLPATGAESSSLHNFCGLDPVVSELPAEFSAKPEHYARLDQELKELAFHHSEVTLIPIGRSPSLLLQLCAKGEFQDNNNNTLEKQGGEGDDVPPPPPRCEERGGGGCSRNIPQQPTGTMLSVQEIVNTVHLRREKYHGSGDSFPWCSDFGVVVVTLKQQQHSQPQSLGGCNCSLVAVGGSDVAPLVGFVAAVVRLGVVE